MLTKELQEDLKNYKNGKLNDTMSFIFFENPKQVDHSIIDHNVIKTLSIYSSPLAVEHNFPNENTIPQTNEQNVMLVSAQYKCDSDTFSGLENKAPDKLKDACIRYIETTINDTVLAMMLRNTLLKYKNNRNLLSSDRAQILESKETEDKILFYTYYNEQNLPLESAAYTFPIFSQPGSSQTQNQESSSIKPELPKNQCS